ncbi:MAG: DUF1624 domain-containing protein [Clostridiales bacterium]|nr:DUF1624 domain-containing protein [Clostridiales bacterium]
MVFYHLYFIAGEFFGIGIAKKLFEFNMPLEPFFACLFIFICGISSCLSRSNLKRGLKLFLIALMLSGITVFILPLFKIEGAEIRFGILHLLSVSILLYAALCPVLKKIPPIVGFSVFFAAYVLTSGVKDGYIGLPFLKLYLPSSFYSHYFLFPLGFHTASFGSMDYFPILPNLFMFLAGTYAGIYVRDGRIPKLFYKSRVPFLSFFGRHALIVYLIHFPAIYAVLLITVTIIERI